MQLLLLAQSPVLRLGLRGILETALPIDQVIEASNALEALQAVQSSAPVLTIIQDSLPGVTGVVAARMCRELHPASVIIVLSEQSGKERVQIASDFGANALLAAEIAPGNLIAAIRSFFEQQVGDGTTIKPNTGGTSLESREIAVLDGIVRGLSLQDIADSLLLGEQLVRAAWFTLLRKLNAPDRTSAVVAAIRGGLVDLSVQLPIHLPLAGHLYSPAESFG